MHVGFLINLHFKQRDSYSYDSFSKWILEESIQKLVVEILKIEICDNKNVI